MSDTVKFDLVAMNLIGQLELFCPGTVYESAQTTHLWKDGVFRKIDNHPGYQTTPVSSYNSATYYNPSLPILISLQSVLSHYNATAASPRSYCKSTPNQAVIDYLKVYCKDQYIYDRENHILMLSKRDALLFKLAF